MQRTEKSSDAATLSFARRARRLACLILGVASALAMSAEDRYAARCRPEALMRFYNPQGHLLCGARQDWDPGASPDDRRSVLVSVELQRPVMGAASVALRDGKLEAAGADLKGTVLRGSSSAGQPVEVAICGEEDDAGGLSWYRIQAWNPVAGAWQNPCARGVESNDPRALAVEGVWDASGARADRTNQFTFACQNGAIAKCVDWGYRPWAWKNGQPLADLHQACTRMARADYCGDGRSHTVDGTTIDIYDSLGVQSLAPPGGGADAFEASWAADGATCLATPRRGQTLADVLRSCAGRFEPAGNLDLGNGDRCVLRRKGGGPPAARLRTRVAPPPAFSAASSR